LAEMRRTFPQFYAMTLLGFATGKRPSTLRPLRRTGPESDVDWDAGFVRFRRSHTRRNETMLGTKTGTTERVYLPGEVMQALRDHVAALGTIKGPRGDKMRASDLLFPSVRGSFRTSSCLDRPFATVGTAIGLPFGLTPRAMRRTFNDLARASQVADVVTRSITGHKTETMQSLYSTAQPNEQREAIAKVIGLVSGGAISGASPIGAPQNLQ
jgi:integrase